MHDAQCILSHNAAIALADQLMVLQQTAGDGVLDGHHADGAGRYVFDHFAKRVAGHWLHGLAFKIALRRHVVIRPRYALYGYFHLHSFLFVVYIRSTLLFANEGTIEKQKIPPFMNGRISLFPS